MIQRIQTLWLLLASISSFLTLNTNISFYSGNKLVENANKFVSLTARENIFLLILTVSVAVASLILIFLFKDRKMQFKITLAVFAFSVINIVLYFLQMKNYTEGNISLSSLIHFAIPLFLILAARSIWKDDQLVKSVDRLR
jgi:hypothetical protein